MCKQWEALGGSGGGLINSHKTIVYKLSCDNAHTTRKGCAGYSVVLLGTSYEMAWEALYQGYISL